MFHAENSQSNSGFNILSVNFGFPYFHDNSKNEEAYKIPFIEIYSHEELFYDNFLKQHMQLNIPCIIKNVSSEWGCRYYWVKDNKPNFHYILEKYGDAQVPVADCSDKYYNSQKKEEQVLNTFLEYWKSYVCNNYSPELPCYYLKDWHFMREFPDEKIYQVPSFFASDWLNEYFLQRQDVHDDYRFVYMGPKGSWTPFHADVFSSFSWSVNICGKKRWVLFPPGQEKCLMDNFASLVYDIDSPSLQDSSKYKDYHKLSRKYEIIQEAGDAIFVPSGWHHQVWNMEDTISINHNWVNGCNIDKMWASLRANLDAVKKEISDCHDMEGWEQHCQVMLNASYGLDLKQFCQFLLYIVNIRVQHLENNEQLTLFNGFTLDYYHMKLDIFQAKNILAKILCDTDFVKLKLPEENEITMAIERIDKILGD
ncbi:2-oxoglutarate and iron-dependent oxygenase JMJD4-like isoform X1 [Macrosteles quadrilineatus]|uniref:2-oxoglutarate and iron-dependent oxygenase JMJD4-like isoform X1 n=1 Tax=Macrosteles quadrilineatus TaxID=74068 RepID=UPI0023E0C32E|nr:2-oxoglutarate and iron-dependent oxygenase JMJD4-like isoform X1 [Macrosteles quadrilineatus]